MTPHPSGIPQASGIPQDPGIPAARFEAWVLAHHAAVYRSAWRITRNGADAEDVAQRVFLHVYEGIARPEWAEVVDPGPRLRWLAVKTALDFRRGEANRRRREEERAMETSEANSGGPDPERAELLARLRADVARLPDELRIATVLRFQEGLTFAAMAEVAGTSEPTMFERVKRALEKLRVGLAQAGHAGALVEIESMLALPEVVESVAVPARLGAALLALPAKTAAAAAATASATTASSAWLAAAAAVVVFAGAGAVAVRSARSSDPVGVEVASGAPAPALAPPSVAAATAPEPARVTEPVRGASNDVRRDGDMRMRAGDLLHCDLGLPPNDAWADRMVDTVHLHGFVGDDDGRALPGVRIEASSIDGAPKSFAWLTKSESGADGAFDLRVAAVVTEGQRYEIRFNDPDMLPTWRSTFVKSDADCDLPRVQMQRNVADRPGEFELTLTLVGRDGEPVQGAIVRMERKLAARATGAPVELWRIAYEWQAGGVTDERGALVLKANRIGTKRFLVNGHRVGYRDLVITRDIDHAGASEQRIVLVPGLTITGRLVPPEGVDAAAFLRGAQLDAVPKSAVAAAGADPGDAYDADVAPDGRFTIRGLDDGPCLVRGRGDFSPFEVADVAAGRADLAFQLKRKDDPSDSGLHRAEIHGRVVDEHGAPLAVLPDDVQVVALPAGWKADDPRVSAEFVPALLAPPMGQTSQVFFDGDAPPPQPSSTFHVIDLDAGNFLIVLRAPGRAPAVSSVVTLAKDQIARDVVVPLAPAK